jgi:hypothetical protein
MLNFWPNVQNHDKTCTMRAKQIAFGIELPILSLLLQLYEKIKVRKNNHQSTGKIS